MNTWTNIQQQKPEPGSRILVCDENGYRAIEDVDDEAQLKSLGYPVPDLYGGRIPTLEEMWEAGNGTKLVAWMPLPDWPEDLCRKDANGKVP
jgi:hypothetical protein